MADCWIAPDDCEQKKNYYFWARRRFQIDTPLTSAVIDVAAESIYQLWVNDDFLSTGPARGSSTVNFFDTIDILPYIRCGENEIRFLVRCDNVPTFKASPTQPALWVSCDSLGLGTDELWEVAAADEFRTDVPLYTLQIGYMEWRHLTVNQLKWKPAKILYSRGETPGKDLLKRDVPMLRATRTKPRVPFNVTRTPPLTDPHSTDVAKLMTIEAHCDAVVSDFPLTINATEGGIAVILDFEREITGGVIIDLDASPGTIVDIGYEEEIHNGRLIVQHDHYAFADRYILSGGRQMVGPTVSERGFRMIQIVIRNAEQCITLHQVEAQDRRYPIDNCGDFECSDLQLNRLWKMSCETLSACATDIFIDCPWRESSFWVNDLLVENITWLQAFGASQLNARALRLAFSERRSNGLIPGVCPVSDDSAIVFPATNLFLCQIVEEYVLFSGDMNIITELIDGLLTILSTVRSWEDCDGLLQCPPNIWNFVDWSYGYHVNLLDGKQTAVVNWFYVSSMMTTCRLLRSIDRNVEANELEAAARILAKAVDRAFWDENREVYLDWRSDSGAIAESSQLTHAVALLSGLIPHNRRQPSIAALTRKDLLEPELYMSHLVFRALAEEGNAAEICNRIKKYWGPMVDQGSPTIWEANVQQHGKAAFSGAGSLCHGFATTPISFMQTVVLGVWPTLPGFAEFTIAPTSVGLSFARGVIPTPHGNIIVAWTTDHRGIRLDLSVPPGTRAILPNKSILLSGDHSCFLPSR